MSRRKLGSANWNKARQKVSLTYESIANNRRDFQEKLSKQLVNEYDLIALEDLNLKGMGSSLHLGKSVHDLGWGEFLWMLKYKAEDAGCTLVFADKHFPSSKLCYSCGFKNTELKLSDREWTCPNCGKHLDRDINAALNLVNCGLGAVSPEVTPVETTVHEAGSLKQECTKRKSCKQSPQVVFTKGI